MEFLKVNWSVLHSPNGVQCCVLLARPNRKTETPKSSLIRSQKGAAVAPIRRLPFTNKILGRSDRNIAMERFVGIVFKLAEAQPNAPLSPAGRVLLQDRLDEFVSHYKTPDHPPYSAMIERALSESNGGRGSCEQSVSHHLRKSYNLLPLAHSALLKHHLSNLCESGEVVSHGKRYMLPLQIATVNLCASVKRNPKRRTCKVQMIKKRNRQDSKKVELVEKDCESGEEEPQFIHGLHSVGKQIEEDCMKRVPTCGIEENCIGDDHSISRTKARFLTVATEETDKKGLYLQKIGPSGVTETDKWAAHMQEQQEHQQTQHDLPELSSPVRPPGFESIRVENLSRMVSKKLMAPTPAEELCDLNCTLQQLKHQIKSRAPRAAAMASPESGIGPKSTEFHGIGPCGQRKIIDSTPISVERMDHKKRQSGSLKADIWEVKQSVMDNTELKGEKKCRRRKINTMQSDPVALDASIELVQPSGIDSEQIPIPCSNTEVQQLPLQQQEPSFHQKQLRRSQRARHATRKIVEGGYGIGILQSEHCLEESQNAFSRRQHRPSKEKLNGQRCKGSSQDLLEAEEPPHLQSRKRQLKLKFVASGMKSAAFVDDNSTQDLKQSRNHDGSTSLSSGRKATKALLHSNSKQRLLEEKTKEQQLVTLPLQHLDRHHTGKRKSARIEGDGLPPVMLALGHSYPVKHQ